MLAENPRNTGRSGDGHNRFGLATSIFSLKMMQSASFLDDKEDVLKGLCQSCSELSRVLDFVLSLQGHLAQEKWLKKKPQLGAERNKKLGVNNDNLWRDGRYGLHSEFV